MSVVLLMVFVSLVLVAGSILLFIFSVYQRDYEHADRLSLAPLANDFAPAPAPGPASPSPHPESQRDETSPRSPQES